MKDANIKSLVLHHFSQTEVFLARQNIMTNFGIAIVALMILQVTCRPQDDSAETDKLEQDGYAHLLDIELQVRHDPATDEAVKKIIAEDWADTWDPPQELKEWFPYRITGKDDDGAVVFLKEFGKWRFTDLLDKYGNESRLIFDKYYEQYLHRLLKEGDQNGGVVMIFDWEGFSMNNFNNRETLKLAVRQLTTLEKTYRVLKGVYMINTNFAAQSMMNLAKPLMGTVLDHAEIYGTQKDKWLPKLLKKLPREVLPADYLNSKN